MSIHHVSYLKHHKTHEVGAIISTPHKWTPNTHEVASWWWQNLDADSLLGLQTHSGALPRGPPAHTHPASLSQGVLWGQCLWEGQRGSLCVEAKSFHREQSRWSVLLASSFKTWNTIFHGKKLCRDVPFCKCMQCKSTLQTIKKYIICL